MNLLKAILCLSLIASFAYAQEDELSLPDLPVVDESPPQEAPFTQQMNEFEDANKAGAPKEVAPDVNAPAAPESSVAAPTPPVSAPVPKRGNAKKGSELIDHPLAAKGLIRIEKDGSYIYKTKTTPHSESGIVRFGSMQSPNIQNQDVPTDFKTMYSTNNVPILMFDYEWQPFSSFGKLGMQLGLGFFTAQGHGYFLVDGKQAEEKYTFIGLPLNVGFIYRLEFSDRQWLAPYIAGGGSYIPLFEIRDDSKAPNAAGTPGAYGAGGLMFNVSSFDRETAYALSSEYGIKNLWIALEYRYLKSFSQNLDVTAGIANLGIAVDY